MCIALAPLSMLAQTTGKVRGFVYDAQTDQPVSFASVSIAGTRIATTTNEQGLYVLNEVPPGTVEVVVQFIGYAKQTKTASVRAGKVTDLRFDLVEDKTILNDIQVSAEKQERETEVLTSVVTLSPKRITQFSVGGDADLIRALQVLPGVITTGDQGGQLYIRGGAPIQNLVQLDQMIIYNPFHSIGFYSVFDADIIQTADVYTAGFNADYGGRTSSVMDIRTRPGNSKRFAGKINASTFSSKLLLEGPLFKKPGAERSSTSFLISGKTSYLDQTDDIFYPYVETEFGGLPFAFTDLYAKVSNSSTNGSNVNVFGFSFSDDVDIDANNSVSWDSRGAGFDFRAIPSGSAMVLDGNLAYSSYDISSIQGDGLPRTSSINGFNGGLNFTYFLRENDELRYGIQAIGYQTNYAFTNQLGSVISQTENNSELAGFMRYKWDAGKLLVEPGVHLHYYGALSEFSIEPRLGMKYTFNDRFRLKGAFGVYSQNLVAATSDRDVVNLFYGFLSSPEDVPSEFSDNKLQTAVHYVLGAEYELTSSIDISVEGYIKDFPQITNLNRNKLYDSDDFTKPEELRTDFIVEEGLAQGVDVLIKGEWGPMYLWTAYSYTVVTRNDGFREYAPHFDRRHNLNLLGTYAWGKQKHWELTVRYNFGSGFPFTPTRGFAPGQTFNNPGGQPQVSYDYTVENGEVKVLYGELNSARLPNYHRVDISLRRQWELTRNQKFEATLSVTNLLNRENIFYFDRLDFKRVDQLPILPSVALAYSF